LFGIGNVDKRTTDAARIVRAWMLNGALIWRLAAVIRARNSTRGFSLKPGIHIETITATDGQVNSGLVLSERIGAPLANRMA